MSFDKWWQYVPKKKAKGDARKAYPVAVRKLQKQHPNEDPHSILIAGIKRYARSKDVADDGIICNPATWLRGERWDDEVEFTTRSPCAKAVSRMDDTTKAEMARAREIRNGRKPRTKPAMNFDLTKAFDPGWTPPSGWYFPVADPYRRRVTA